MIDVYGQENCMGCKATKRWLDQNNVDYEYHDVAQDSVALDTVFSLGYSGVPVVVTPDAHWNGFDLTRLKELLPGA